MILFARPENNSSWIGEDYFICAGIKSEADSANFANFDILRTFAAEKRKKGKQPNAARETAMLESLKWSIEEDKRKLDAQLAAKEDGRAAGAEKEAERKRRRTKEDRQEEGGEDEGEGEEAESVGRKVEEGGGSSREFYDDYVQRLEGNYRHHEDTTTAFRDQVISGNAGLHADLTNLTHTVSTGQSTLNTKLEDISTTLSRVSVQNNHLVSITTVTAPSEGLLAPIVRAELRRVIISTVQQCFEKYKASSDRQLDDIRKKIDEMAQHIAVFSGNADACRFLLNEGSDTKATDAWGATLFDNANIGFGKAGKDGDRPAIIDMLQHSDSDTLEHTSENWEYFLCDALIRPWFCPESVRSEYRSTYLQRLKQLGIRLSKEPHSQPSIFSWIQWICSNDVTMKPGIVEFIFQTMLGFGADTSARTHGLSPLHFVFLVEPDFSDDKRVNVQRHNLMEIIKALLKHGADLFALTHNGHSVLDIAEQYGWAPALYEVLQQTGYDLDEVRLKILLTQLIFLDPDITVAASTAIDSILNEPSSVAGLNLRRALPGDRLED
ncbi:MAG: hypothetical protein Q9205_007063 [Flavoplaca limonia]